MCSLDLSLRCRNLRSLFRVPLTPFSRFCTCVVQTNWFGQCQCYCVIKAGQREIGKTRPQKLAAELAWEQPEERFRLPISPLNNAFNTTAGEPGEPGGMTIRSDGEDRQQPHDEPAVPPGCDLTISKPALLPGCDLTISVWSKRTIGGSQDLLGTATVPTRYVEHPPGDARLTLHTSANRDEAPSDDLSRHRGDNDAGRAEEEQRGTKSSKPLPASTKQNKGDGSSWRGGLFKTLRGTKAKGRGKGKDYGRPPEPIGYVHVWLGKAIRTSASGHQPGKGLVTLRVHAAAGLRKVCKYVKKAANQRVPNFLAGLNKLCTRHLYRIYGRC